MLKTFLASSAFLITSVVFAQTDDASQGAVITKDIPVSSFTSLKASGVYELNLLQGSTESVKIEAPETMQQYFEVASDGGKLTVDMKTPKVKNAKFNGKMKVTITFKQLNEMQLDMVGNVKSAEALTFANLILTNKSVGNVQLKLSASSLQVKNNSVGNVSLSGKAETATIKNTGVGNFNAGDLVIQTLKIDNSGVGHAEVNAAKELTVKDSMLSRVKNKGAAVMKKNNKVEI